MGNSIEVIAIIPARGGSKGIPKKNIIDLAGRPLIAWSIEQARNSQLVDIIFVSTDDDKVADISRQYGAKIIKRPPKLATDFSSSEDVLIHAIDFIENKRGITIDLIIFLQATSPLREKNDIDNAIRQFLSKKADSLLSCTKLEDYFIWEKKGTNCFSVNYDYRKRKRRQDIELQYLENGSIYIFKPELIRKEHNRLGGKIVIYEMEFWKSYQVDDWDDLDICEYYIKKKLLKRRRSRK